LSLRNFMIADGFLRSEEPVGELTTILGNNQYLIY